MQSKSRPGLDYTTFGHRCYINPPVKGIILDTNIKKNSRLCHLREQNAKIPALLLEERWKKHRMKPENPGRLLFMFVCENGSCLLHPIQCTLTECPTHLSTMSLHNSALVGSSDMIVAPWSPAFDDIQHWKVCYFK